MLSFLSLLFLISCANDAPKTIELAEEAREIVTYIRTVAITNSEFKVGEIGSASSIGLEVQDEKEGDQFDKSPFGLPRFDLDISFDQALVARGVSLDEVQCKDQFLLHLNIKLSNGRSFSVGDASSKILDANDFWSSPFCYTINVVAPINTELFTGVYKIKSVLYGQLRLTFGATQLVTIFEGGFPNAHAMKLRYRLSVAQKTKRTFLFTEVSDEIGMTKNLLSSKIGFCNIDPAILLGLMS